MVASSSTYCASLQGNKLRNCQLKSGQQRKSSRDFWSFSFKLRYGFHLEIGTNIQLSKVKSYPLLANRSSASRFSAALKCPSRIQQTASGRPHASRDRKACGD